MRWFDAHLDLGCLAVNGRDMTLPPERAGGPFQPGCVTFPALRQGPVDALLGTIFTEANGADAEGYPAQDAEAAHRVGVAQLDLYHQWARGGLMSLPGSPNATSPRVMILVEGADPIRTPDELEWWIERGVRAIGLTWARGSRYAGGNLTAGVGLSPLGVRLLERMIELGVVHDVSHLSRRAFDDAVRIHERVGGGVIASHSNCAALVAPENERHLTDDQIRWLASRGGVIGLNLVRNFIRPGLDRSKPDRPTIAEAIDHVARITELAGQRRCVGMGSDLDGGITALDLPEGIDGPRDFNKFAQELARRGWQPQEIEGFAWSNWARVFLD